MYTSNVFILEHSKYEFYLKINRKKNLLERMFKNISFMFKVLELILKKMFKKAEKSFFEATCLTEQDVKMKNGCFFINRWYSLNTIQSIRTES